jgi:hypothetical protein
MENLFGIYVTEKFTYKLKLIVFKDYYVIPKILLKIQLNIDNLIFINNNKFYVDEIHINSVYTLIKVVKNKTIREKLYLYSFGTKDLSVTARLEQTQLIFNSFKDDCLLLLFSNTDSNKTEISLLDEISYNKKYSLNITLNKKFIDYNIKEHLEKWIDGIGGVLIKIKYRISNKNTFKIIKIN